MDITGYIIHRVLAPRFPQNPRTTFENLKRNFGRICSNNFSHHILKKTNRDVFVSPGIDMLGMFA